MKGKTQKTIIILWGIPGSGKTTYAKEKESHNKTWPIVNNVKIVDLDRLFETKQIGENYKFIINNIDFSRHISFIFDGLITTNMECKKLIDSFDHLKKYDFIFKIVYWEKDIESCIYNDKGRRKESSVLTIQNISFEEPNLEFLGISSKNIEFKKVVRKSDFMVWINNNSYSDLKLMSETWSLGGSYGNCYNSEKISIEPSDSIPNFDKFDEFLLEIVPNISFLQYKCLYNYSVTQKSEYESDYYGGGQTKAWFECDLEKLYDKLKHLQLVIS